MPIERTKINVDIECYELIKDFAAKIEKQTGLKTSYAGVMKMLLNLGYEQATGKRYKSKTGKDYKPKRKE